MGWPLHLVFCFTCLPAASPIRYLPQVLYLNADPPAMNATTVPPGTYIAVCGPIGVGKSALAEYLAKELDAIFIAEKFDAAANPFLPRFYNERATAPVADGSLHSSQTPTWSLATELSFLVQRIDMVRDITVQITQGTSIIADWAAPQNLVFSRLTLPSDEFELYRSLYNRLMEQVRLPDLIVCLDAPLATLQKRIQGRSRSMESAIAAPYLAAVRHGYSFWRLAPPAPILWLDTDNLSIQNERDRLQVLAQIKDRLALLLHASAEPDLLTLH